MIADAFDHHDVGGFVSAGISFLIIPEHVGGDVDVAALLEKEHQRAVQMQNGANMKAGFSHRLSIRIGIYGVRRIFQGAVRLCFFLNDVGVL
ncbi:hypothetical protein U14_04334 [Candidatus Moduliflexus flocculans]|uniref:Uncharacterized protein n=1 Tax=Candidatus Moduliflexus flocculans TaxID=1499966 RepID=A0A0S6W4M5_9BACT|nr:hypothetical protein U14_04334 [Candidatus Moduliflexus flocculans]